MTGDFAILRNENAQALDVLAMKVKLDNKKAGCGGEPVDYSNADIRLSLNGYLLKQRNCVQTVKANNVQVYI